jgi:hypothetical protein
LFTVFLPFLKQSVTTHTTPHTLPIYSYCLSPRSQAPTCLLRLLLALVWISCNSRLITIVVTCSCAWWHPQPPAASSRAFITKASWRIPNAQHMPRCRLPACTCLMSQRMDMSWQVGQQQKQIWLLRSLLQLANPSLRDRQTAQPTTNMHAVS